MEASRQSRFSPPCLKSCRRELGGVKGVSCWLFARLLVELHHLLGWPCQLAHPLGKLKEAYHNLTRNLSSSINLLVTPQLLSTCSFPPSAPQCHSTCAAADAPHQLCCSPGSWAEHLHFWAVTSRLSSVLFLNKYTVYLITTF